MFIDMSSWVVEEKRTWPEWLVLQVLRVGPIPSHVALIMDGNRRFAKQHQQSAIHGHTQGFKTLTNVLAWCWNLGITEVTAYAFSIENFKRSKEEVDGLMAIMVEKFEQLLNESEKLAKHGVCIRILGNLKLLPLYIQCQAAEAMLLTKNNKKYILNLAIAYTSSDEITTAVKECAMAVMEGRLEETDITPRLLEDCLYTAQSQHPDLLIRTSGETRLSDFLLWQSQFSCLYFTKVLWPELSIWHIFGAVFHYQRHHHTITAARKEAALLNNRYETDADQAHTFPTSADRTPEETRMLRVQGFLERLQQQRLDRLHELSVTLKELKIQMVQGQIPTTDATQEKNCSIMGKSGGRAVTVSVSEPDPALLLRLEQRVRQFRLE